MRTVRIKIYQFHELSEKAKQVAFNEWLNNPLTFGHLLKEASNSIEGFAKHFNCTVTDLSIDLDNLFNNKFCFDIPAREAEKGKVERWKQIETMGTYDATSMKGLGDCVFTGVCYDDDLADGARKAFYDGVETLSYILYAGVASLLSSLQDEYEHMNTLKYFANEANELELEFTVDGKLFHKK